MFHPCASSPAERLPVSAAHTPTEGCNRDAELRVQPFAGAQVQPRPSLDRERAVNINDQWQQAIRVWSSGGAWPPLGRADLF